MRLFLIFTLTTVTLSFVPTAGLWAQAPADNPPQSADEKAREFVRLQTQLKGFLDQKQYDQAVETCQKMVVLMPEAPGVRFFLACCQARQGHQDEAFATLTKAAELGFSEVDTLQTIEDLAPLRDDQRFAPVLTRVKANDAAAVEKGDEIPQVKTVEGAPANGLRYRLRMSPAATKEKPNRLLVWLHPAGQSMNKTIEALAPRLNQQGFALLVFTRKDFRFWNPADATRIAKTLDEVAKVEGISDQLPILMGFSAGGQMALELWYNHPEGLGGLVLDAAYPLQALPNGQVAVRPPPVSEAGRKVPLFALVGLKDGGSQLWKAAEPTYKQAGIPLTIQYLENRKHEWLFGENELTALDKWLGEAAAAKAPGADQAAWRPSAAGEVSAPTGLVKFAEGQKNIVVPVQPAGQMLVVKPKINGQDAGWFVVDTGGQVTMLSRTLAASLKLPITQQGEAHGVGGTTQIAFRKVDSLSLGDLTLGAHTVVDQDLKAMSDMLGLDLSGVLGGSLWTQVPFTVDYTAGTITFHNPKEFKPPAGAREEKLELLNNRPAVKVLLGGKVEALLILDTAGSRFVNLSDPAIVKQNPELIQAGAVHTVSTMGVSGTERLKLGELSSVKVFGQTFDKVQAQYSEGGTEGAAKPPFAGIFGAPMLEHFRLTFDYANKKVYAEPRPILTLPERLAKGLKVNDQDVAGFTPLHTAAAYGQKEDVLKLLAAKANPNAADNIGRTPLHSAANSGGVDIVKLLLAKGADAKVKTKSGMTPLNVALLNGQMESAQALLAAGAPVNSADEAGNTPLMQAAAAGDVTIVKTLLKAKADVTARNNLKETALMAGVHSDSPEVIGVLIAAKVELNAVDQQGTTALIRAAFLGKARALEALLAAKPDLTIKTPKGYTALKVARERKLDPIVQLLEKAGAKE